MRIDHNTSDRILFPILVVLIFAFTSVVFILYDWHVSKRQKKLLETAINKAFDCNLLERMVKERTDRLQQMNSKLEKANKAVLRSSQAQLQHFACMSHEIRTPLNSVIGYASLMEETKLDEMQRESIETIIHSGKLLLSIVNDVLDYSKLETGNVVIEKKPTYLRGLFDLTVRTMDNKAKSTSLVLKGTYDDSQVPTYIETDGWRLQQILYNLLSNACKFSKTGGTVELDFSVGESWYSLENDVCYFPPTEREIMSNLDSSAGSCNTHCSSRTSSHVAVNNMNVGKMLRFTVTDYGKGIAKSDYEKIFLPFLQTGSEDEIIYGGKLCLTFDLLYLKPRHIVGG
jgi:signal transduction histidine kinase